MLSLFVLVNYSLCKLYPSEKAERREKEDKSRPADSIEEDRRVLFERVERVDEMCKRTTRKRPLTKSSDKRNHKRNRRNLVRESIRACSGKKKSCSLSREVNNGVGGVGADNGVYKEGPTGVSE